MVKVELLPHLDARVYANGQPSLPNQLELASWLLWRQQTPNSGLPSAEQPADLLLEPGLTGPTELPAIIRWSDIVPTQQGNLQQLILGVRLDHQGNLAPVTISLYDLFHTLVAASSGWGKSAFANSLLPQLATCPEPVEGLLTTIAWQLEGEDPVYALEGAIFITGAAVQWLRDGLGIIEHASETGPLAGSCPDTEGVYLVPAFTGLGSPWWGLDIHRIADSGELEPPLVSRRCQARPTRNAARSQS